MFNSKLAFIMWESAPVSIFSFLMTQMVKSPPATKDIHARLLSQEDPLEEGMAINSNILAWRISRTEKPGGLQSVGLQRVRRNWVTITFAFTQESNLCPLHWGGRVLTTGSPGKSPVFLTNALYHCYGLTVQWLNGKQFACNAGSSGDLGSIPGSGGSCKEGMALLSSILAQKTPWTEASGGLQSMGLQKHWVWLK